MRFKLFLEHLIEEEAILSLDNIGVYYSPNDDMLAIYRKDEDIKQALKIGNPDLFINKLKPAILGVMIVQASNDYYDEIISVAAEKGYGPLLYLLAMQLSKHGLIADQDEGDVSEAAKKIWSNFYSGQGKHLVKIVGDLESVHQEEYLRHAYKNITNYNIKPLIAETNKLIDSSSRYSIPKIFRTYVNNIVSPLYTKKTP